MKSFIFLNIISHTTLVFFLILFITYVLFYFASLNYSVHSYLHVYSNVKQTQPVFAKLLKCSTKKIHKHFFFYVNYVQPTCADAYESEGTRVRLLYCVMTLLYNRAPFPFLPHKFSNRPSKSPHQVLSCTLQMVPKFYPS